MQKEMLVADSESEEQSSQSEEGDFFTSKQKKVEESESEEDQITVLPSLSKRKMRKIKEEGPYAGKNILVFDSQGKAVPKPSILNNDRTNYFESLRKNQVEGEDTLMLQPGED